MIPLGPVPAGNTLYVPFNTFDANGASVTISNFAVGDIKIYKNGSTTERSSTSGYVLLDTDGIDFDGITGIHGFSVDLSDNTDAGFYAAGSFYWIVISSITVNTQTVNFVAATFRIVASDPLMPTTAGRTLDVSAGGEAGVDWANVGSPTTVLNLSGTTVKTATDVETDTQDIQSRLPAALVSGRIDASVGAMAANVLTATAIAADAITAAKVADGTIDAATFAASAITATAIASNAITSAKIATDALTPTHIKSLGRGTADSGASTTSIPTSACTPAGAVADQFAGRVILFDDDTTTTALRGQATSITASSNDANPTFTVTALTTAPAAGDLFSIV